MVLLWLCRKRGLSKFRLPCTCGLRLSPLHRPTDHHQSCLADRFITSTRTSIIAGPTKLFSFDPTRYGIFFMPCLCLGCTKTNPLRVSTCCCSSTATPFCPRIFCMRYSSTYISQYSNTYGIIIIMPETNRVLLSYSSNTSYFSCNNVPTERTVFEYSSYVTLTNPNNNSSSAAILVQIIPFVLWCTPRQSLPRLEGSYSSALVSNYHTVRVLLSRYGAFGVVHQMACVLITVWFSRTCHLTALRH